MARHDTPRTRSTYGKWHCGLDRKTVRRYVAAAQACGLDRAGGEGQLSDELISGVAERVRPHRTDGHGQSWAVLAAHHEEVKGLLGEGLTVVRVHELLARRGVVVPERTLHRYALEVLGAADFDDWFARRRIALAERLRALLGVRLVADNEPTPEELPATRQ